MKQTKYSSLDLTIHMVETSKKCSLEQSSKLCCSELQTDLSNMYYQHGITSKDYGMKKVFWYKSINDVPKNTFSLIVAQEFFDALSIHKFRVSKNLYEYLLVEEKLILFDYCLEN